MRAAVCALVLLISLGIASAQSVDPANALPAQPVGKLVVGTVPVPPFIIKGEDGSWGGISMDLWKEVARRLKLDYEVRELVAADLKDLPKVKVGTVDPSQGARYLTR